MGPIGLIVLGLVIILVVRLLLVLIPAALVAVVVWFFTGNTWLAGFGFPDRCGFVHTQETVDEQRFCQWERWRSVMSANMHFHGYFSESFYMQEHRG